MKKCPICGNNCNDSAAVCPICSTILPKTATSTAIKAEGAKQIKLCPCGTENKEHALRCKSCGRFLDNIPTSNSYDNSEKTMTFRIKARVSSGEEFEITEDTVLGRQYQKELWDCYTHRAAYHIHYDKAAKVMLIDDLKMNSSQPLKYNHNYRLGRKTINFSKEK